MRHATVGAGSCHRNSSSIKEAAALLQFSAVMNFPPAAACIPANWLLPCLLADLINFQTERL